MTGAPAFNVRMFSNRAEMGRVAAAAIAHDVRACLANKARVRVMFAAAPSQQDMLEALVAEPDVAWDRVSAFHMDEYVGLAPTAAERFVAWLDERLFRRVPFGDVQRIEPSAFASPQDCADDYARRLAVAPMDVVCLGIGVNGHLAFNDPPVADFADPHAVKLVPLDLASRQQQVDEGNFPTLADVPTHAVTVTIPPLMQGRASHCVVPGPAKREAVRRTLSDPISTACPATILRTHPNCTLYLDAGSAADA